MLTQFLKNEMLTLVGVLILRYPTNIGGQYIMSKVLPITLKTNPKQVFMGEKMRALGKTYGIKLRSVKCVHMLKVVSV